MVLKGESIYEKKINIKTLDRENGFSFLCVKDAIFWAVELLHHQHSGGYVRGGNSLFYKDFEPVDVVIPLWRLVRNGTLTKQHQDIVMSYGIEGIEPIKNSSDYKIWDEVIEALEPILKTKKILKK